MEKKLLIALDTSVYSSNTLHYLEQLFAHLDDIRLHLFTVVTCYPADTAGAWLNVTELQNTLSKEEQKRFAAAGKFLHTSAKRLERSGISSDRITTEVKLSVSSPAAEILHVGRQGMYDALVLGRRGISRLEELIMGSVSSDMFEKCHDLPLWIVDGQVDSRKFLVPVDGSRFTLQAVDHLCFILKDNPYAEITLFHSAAMFARRQELDPEYCNRYLSMDWCRKHRHDADFHFLAPSRMLVKSGFPPGRIHRLETAKGMYPSRQIVRQALIDDFGTIVMGRRAADAARGVFGSITEKVVAMSVNNALWIIG